MFAIGCVHDDDRIGRDVGCAAARFYYGDNDAELNHVRFGSSEGVARIKARISGCSDDDLLQSGMAIGGNADSVCRQVERRAATGIDQMVFMFQIGRTTHDQIMRSIEIVGEKVIRNSPERHPEEAEPTKSSVRLVRAPTSDWHCFVAAPPRNDTEGRVATLPPSPKSGSVGQWADDRPSH